jgi:hypothetical protein
VYSVEKVAPSIRTWGQTLGESCALFLVPVMVNGQLVDKVRPLTIYEQFSVQGIPREIMDEARKMGATMEDLLRMCGNTVAVATADVFMRREMDRLSVIKRAIVLSGDLAIKGGIETVTREQWCDFAQTQHMRHMEGLKLQTARMFTLNDSIHRVAVVAKTVDDHTVMCVRRTTNGRRCAMLPGGLVQESEAPAQAALRHWESFHLSRGYETQITEQQIRTSGYSDIDGTRYYEVELMSDKSHTDSELMYAVQTDGVVLQARAVDLSEVWTADGVFVETCACDSIVVTDLQYIKAHMEKQQSDVSLQTSYVRRIEWCRQQPDLKQHFTDDEPVWAPVIGDDVTGDVDVEIQPSWKAPNRHSLPQLIATVGTNLKRSKFRDALAKLEIGKPHQAELCIGDGDVDTREVVSGEGTDSDDATLILPEHVTELDDAELFRRRETLSNSSAQTGEGIVDEGTQTKTVVVKQPQGTKHAGELVCEYEVWHRKFSHAGPKPLCNPKRKLRFASRPHKAVKCKCEVCELSKINRRGMAQHSSESRWFHMPKARVEAPQNCWHMDIGGPYVKSRHGHYEWVIVFSSPCGIVLPQFTRTRATANVCAALLKILAMLPPNQMLHLQADHAGEFTSKEFEALCAVNGIKLTTTPRASSEFNATAERSIQTLKKLTVCNLVAAGCGSTWWPLAMSYAAVCQSLLIHGDNPASGMQMALNYEMPLHRLHIWGNNTVVWKHPTLRKDDFDARGVLGMFCGIDVQRNCYLIQVPGQGLVRAHTCHFDDTVGANSVVKQVLASEGVTADDAEMAHMKMDDFGQPIEFYWGDGISRNASDSIEPAYAYGGVHERQTDDEGVTIEPSEDATKSDAHISHLPEWKTRHKALDEGGHKDRSTRSNQVDRIPAEMTLTGREKAVPTARQVEFELSVEPTEESIWDNEQWLQQVQDNVEAGDMESIAAMMAQAGWHQQGAESELAPAKTAWAWTEDGVCSVLDHNLGYVNKVSSQTDVCNNSNVMQQRLQQVHSRRGMMDQPPDTMGQTKWRKVDSVAERERVNKVMVEYDKLAVHPAEIPEPITVVQARKTPQWQYWETAIAEEMLAQESMSTFELGIPPGGVILYQ